MNKIIHTNKKLIASILFSTLCLAFISTNVIRVNAQTLTDTSSAEDPTKSTFKIVICDGPDISGITSETVKQKIYTSAGKTSAKDYIPCDFKGMMMQVQHLINILMVLGVFAAIILLTYAGYLFMTGVEGDRNKGKDILPKIVWGFVIMLVAWVVVYELLNWLTGSGSVFTKLLGK